MNILVAKIVEKSGKLIVDEGDFQLAIEGPYEEKLKSYVDKEVLFGIRPEDLVYQESPQKTNNIKTRVEVVEPLGAEIHLYVRTQNHELIARVAPRYEFKVGAEANFKPDLEKLHFFDIETEEVI